MWRRDRSGCAVAVVICLTLSNPCWSSVQAQDLSLEYHLAMPEPATHFYHVTITADNVTAPHLDFSMPAWSPGRYAIYNFAKNVQEVQANDGQGRTLPVDRLDKQTWRVQRGGSRTIEVSYKVYANRLSGTFSQLNETHANYNGASIYMYIADHKDAPISLTIEKPAEWDIATGLKSDGQPGKYLAANYDLLIDSPVEMSKFMRREFEVEGTMHEVIVHGDGREVNIDALVEDLSAVVSTLEQVIGEGLPYSRYVFLYHFDPYGDGDGMEHLNSTQIIRRYYLSDVEASPEDDRYEGLIWVSAHEFFHLWNVKRLRPEGLGPFDYSKEVNTPNLWIAEGITSYYATLALRRMGFYDDVAFYDEIAHPIRELQRAPGNRLTPVEMTSFLTWFFIRPAEHLDDTNLDNVYYSYYTKGQLLGMLLDLEIRHRTASKKSLNDVFRRMFDTFFRDAKPESYYLQGRGYEASDFQRAVEEVAGSSFAPFFQKYVQGTAEIPYNQYLTYAGLQLDTTVAEIPYLGLRLEEDSDGLPRIRQILPDGPAYRAGLDKLDLIIAVDGERVAMDRWYEFWRLYEPGQKAVLTVLRRDHMLDIPITVEEPHADDYVVGELDDAAEAQKDFRALWLGVPSY